MLQSLKQKTWSASCGPSSSWLWQPFSSAWCSGPESQNDRWPTHFTPLDDHDVLSLQGQYLEADIDTLIDYYAETVRSESGKRDEVSAREYIMPINTPRRHRLHRCGSAQAQNQRRRGGRCRYRAAYR